jgi:hypothetical protein
LTACTCQQIIDFLLRQYLSAKICACSPNFAAEMEIFSVETLFLQDLADLGEPLIIRSRSIAAFPRFGQR